MSLGRGVVTSAAVGALAAVLAWAAGVEPAHVAALGIATGAVAGALTLVPSHRAREWPEEQAPRFRQGWHQVALLASLLRQSDVDPDRPAVLHRLRALSVRRLARANVPWADPRARDLLTGELYDVLDGRLPPPRATRLAAAVLARLDAIDTLDVADPPPGWTP